PELGAAIGAERFLREIQMVARLRHPHIVPLYDSGEAAGQLYYVMPYVKGESIRQRIARAGPFAPDEAVRLVREVADALEYAHGEGLVHRDIKPDNIMLDERHALVMDFGIARAFANGTDQPLTGTGLLVGTPAYMSPEQVTGESDIDGRSDIYSLGCVLFEMLAGKPPFAGPTAHAVMARRFSAPTPSLASIENQTSPELQKVLSTAMSLAPEARYQTAHEMIEGLDDAREVTPSRLTKSTERPETPSASPAASVLALSEKPSRRRAVIGGTVAVAAAIAVTFLFFSSRSNRKALSTVAGVRRVASIGVLPFTNQSGDKQMEYFTDGLTDELISALSQVRGLEVAGRASSFSIKGKNLDAREAAQRLQVAYVVDAGVRSGGSRVRVTWQLMDGRTGKALGSGNLDGDMRDVISLQDSMARTIVEGLGPVIGQVSPDPMRKHQTANYEAHDLYLKGHFYWNQRTAETMRQGIAYLKEAIGKDSAYALAWAELSSAYTIEPIFGDMKPSDAIPLAREAAQKALELDPTLSEANVAMGMSLTFNDWNPRAALPYLDRAIALDPQNSFPRLFRAWPLVMVGRGDDALAEIRRARALDPLSPIVNTRVGTTLLFVRRFAEAETELRKVVSVDPSNLLARAELGVALGTQGKSSEALSQMPDAIDAEAGGIEAALAWAEARAGNTDRARAILSRMEARSKERYLTPLAMAVAASAAGDRSLALDYIEEGLREHAFYIVFLRVDPKYEALRGEPRFERVLQAVEKKYSSSAQ
ncbi:MAG: protein kinase, partial [Gemmatimonadaceae bacterium]